MPEQTPDKKDWLSASPGRPIVCALILFVVINISLSLLKPSLPIKPTELPVRLSWEWWRTNSYLAEPKTPDVVLMGSSLLLIPTALVDADYLNKNIDVVTHPHCNFLESKLIEAGAPTKTSCFSFALPGAMISDQYLTEHCLFEGNRKPKLLVLGLTLRDFIDNGVDSATSTPPYQFFKHFSELNDVRDLLTVSTQAKAESCYNRLNYLFDKRLELQAYFAKPVNKVGAAALADIPVNNEFDSKKAQSESDGDIFSGAAVAEGAFIVPPHKVIQWKDNTREYKKRFATSNQRLFVNQLAFLDKLLADAQAKNIKVVVANMPLTDKNMSLMPNGMYEKYLSEINTRAQQGKLSLIDLNTQWVFEDSDFQDTAHLNGVGGAKFMDLLAKSLSLNERVRVALNMANNQSIGATKRTKSTIY